MEEAINFFATFEKYSLQSCSKIYCTVCSHIHCSLFSQIYCTSCSCLQFYRFFFFCLYVANCQLCRFLNLPLTVECMCRKGLRVISYQDTRKVEAGYKLSQTTETLIGYTACYRLVFFVFSHFSYQFPIYYLAIVLLDRHTLWQALAFRAACGAW